VAIRTASPGPAGPASADRDIAERDGDGVHILRVAGELDLTGAARFCARVDAARDAGHRRLLIDLTPLRSCETRALRALMGAAEEFVASGGSVALVRPADADAGRLFTLTVADERIPLHSHVEEAVARLERHGRPPG
jgi:anti-anti-sigma factor